MKKPKSNRALLLGLYIAGLFYALVVLFQGRIDYGVITAIIIETTLLVGSLITGPLNKKGLALLCLGIVLYVSLATLLGTFSEVVIMAAGGLAVYGFVASEPKFPLTKRALGTGVVVGVVMTFLGIYLALKLGVVYFVGAELLGFLILTLFGKYTPEENAVVVAIANSSSMVSIGVLITFPAIAIFQPSIASSLITYQFIAFVTGTSAIFGLILMVPFRDRFMDEPWPQVLPQAECINCLGADVNAKRTVIAGLGAAASWTAATRAAEYIVSSGTESPASFSSFPNAVSPIVPDWIGINNSPLIAAIGFFVGWKRVLIMAAGSLISLVIWLTLEGAAFIPFGEHLTRPEILYLALGVFASIILGDVFTGGTRDELPVDEFERSVNQKSAETNDAQGVVIEDPHSPSELERLMRLRRELFSVKAIKEEIRAMLSDPSAYLDSRKGQIPPWVAIISMLIFMAIGIFAFWIVRLFSGLQIHWLLFVIGSPLALVSAYFTARSISETGMLAGYISDTVAIPAILFFRLSFAAITTFMTMLGALQDAAIAVLVHLKLGSLTGVKGKDILKAVFVGALLGTSVGSLITYMIFLTYGFGGSDFPSPAAHLFGFLVVSLTGLGNLEIPGVDQLPNVHPYLGFAYLFAFGVIGFLAGRELSKRGMSPMSLAVGLLIPPATTVTMLIGGYIDYRMKREVPVSTELDSCGVTENFPRYERVSRLLSGVVAGEAIVTVIWVLWSAISFFA
ncbi:hypothetical protein EU537_07660 [Candidatus Thorarchaeota archaeon]|nr:MAG: hypothetical protein EU537_07660 [Candidatus Thorarchaeota archaeon]